MTGSDHYSQSPVDILLRKLMLFGGIALLGILAGLIGWPVIQAEILVRKLDDRDKSTRIEAMNDLAPIAVSSSAYLTPLLNAVLDEPKQGDADSVALADEVGVWVLKRSSSAQKKTERLLETSGTERFRHLSNLMVAAGLWDQQPQQIRFRREWVRLQAPDPGVRISALRSLAKQDFPKSDIPWYPSMIPEDSLKELPSEVLSSIQCDYRQLPNIVALLLHDETDEAVRREELALFARRSPRQLQCMSRYRSDANIQEALIWNALIFGEIPEHESRTIWFLSPGNRSTIWWCFSRDCSKPRCEFPADDPDVAPMAAWAYGVREIPLKSEWIDLALEQGTPLLRWRNCVALGRTKQMTVERARQFAESEDAEQFMPALLVSLGRCDSSDEAADWVATRIEEGLQKGIESWVAAGCEAFGEMANPRAIPLLHGLIEELNDQPLVQWAAARALLKLKRQDGIDALFELLKHDDDSVGDLVTWTLGTEVDPVREDWRRLNDQNGPGAYRSEIVHALWLARGKGFSVDITKQLNTLRMKTVDKTSPTFEPDWKPHGYYLCARLLLGDIEARAALEPFISNPAFPRFALFASLLGSGDTAPYDLFLVNWGPKEAESFLCNTRFIEVVKSISPDAPTFEWFEDPEIRTWQTQRMRDWWWLRQDQPANKVLRSLRDDQPAESD